MHPALIGALVVALIALLVVVGVAFQLRRRFLLFGLGAVTMWVRRPGTQRWSLGVAWYGSDVLLWYRGLSFAVRPHERLSRAVMEITGQRSARRDDLALPADLIVVQCTTSDGPRELAMDRSTVTGLLSWLESAPPR
ncbi:MAG: hypothetical protein QOJ68_1380 [Blastococcus sp.]|nr:hypothetical protein [Blastococcus sp.]